jgi:hypothetical protein
MANSLCVPQSYHKDNFSLLTRSKVLIIGFLINLTKLNNIRQFLKPFSHKKCVQCKSWDFNLSANIVQSISISSTSSYGTIKMYLVLQLYAI